MAKSKRKRRDRVRKNYGRQLGHSPSRKNILIVCEGKKTEPIYFKALCEELNLKSVTIEGSGACYQAVVEHALESRKRRKREAKKKSSNNWGKEEFDEVWCVFDFERAEDKQSLYRAVSKAQAHGLKLAISAPCFEFWYLLHFKYTTQPFQNASEVIKLLKKIIPDYEKNTSVFEQLSGYTDKAITTAKKLRKNQSQEGKYSNPSTEVDKLVEALKKMSD
ncbi:MAG: RloB family protein [Ardenticatenaceae bacterium]